MHICMTCAENILQERRGAIAPYVYRLSRELSHKNYVDILSIGNGEKQEENMHIQTSTYNTQLYNVLRKIFGYALAHHTLSNAYFTGKVFHIHRSFPIDVLHVHDIYATLVAATCKLGLYIPTVISLHNKIRIALPLRFFDKVLVVSEYLKEFMVKEGFVKPSKIDVLPPAVDVDVYKPTLSKDQAKKELELQNSKVILFVGRKCPSKGPQVLIESLPTMIKRNPEVIVVLIGPDFQFSPRTPNSQTYTKFLKAKAKRLKIKNHVIFEGFVPEGLLRLYYNAADVFVFPSIWQEPFGLTIVEALAYEKPVIASNVGGVLEIVTNGINGLLIPPNDPIALANAVRYMLENSEFAERLGKNGRKTVLESFSFQVIAKRCLEIYEKIVR